MAVVEVTETEVTVQVVDSAHAVAPILYLIQTEDTKHWVDTDFIQGFNIIGVRNVDADVYLPHNLSVEKLVSVKNEMSSGTVAIYSY